MARRWISWGRVALVVGVTVLLAGGLLVYDAVSPAKSSRDMLRAAKTPVSQLTVKVIPLIPGSAAQEVIALADEKQQGWAKRLTSKEGLQALVDSLGQAFPFNYQLGETLVIPDECFVFKRKQYDADKVQFWLLKQRNKEDYLTLGMLPAYMFADSKPWLSGRARLGNPVAIMSSWRMGLRIPDGDPRLVSRWHTLVRHELGHTMGLHHVENRDSLMFGGQTLEDLDAQSTQLTKEDWQRLDEVCPVEWDE